MSNINDLKKFLLGLYLNSISSINLDELETFGYMISDKNISKLIDEGILIFGGNNTFYITIDELQKKNIIKSMNHKELFYYIKLSDNYIQNIFELNYQLAQKRSI